MSELPPDTVLLKAFEDASHSGVSHLMSQLGADRFETRILTGEGGAKRIYKVTDTVTGRSIALARPRGDSPFEHDYLLREATLHARLEHPNIVRLYDIGVDREANGDVTPYFTMKFVDGHTLKSYLQAQEDQAGIDSGKESLKSILNDRLDIFTKVCDAIAYAHDRGVCHLDLKPANIFISSHHEVLVGDWGLARDLNARNVISGERPSFSRPEEMVDRNTHSDQSKRVRDGENTAFTLQGTISGTPGYMSPEQCSRMQVIDGRSDIYSLGAIFYYLFTGKPPVTGSVDERLKATVAGRLDIALDDLIQGAYDRNQMLLPLPESLAHVLAKALEPEPAKRYQHVSELRDDIRQFQLGYLTSVEPASTGRQLMKLIRRHPIISSMTVFFLAVITITTGVYIESMKRSESETAQALHKLQLAVNDKRLLTRKRAEDAFMRARSLYENRDLGRMTFSERDIDLAYSEVKLSISLDQDEPRLWLLKGKLALLLGDFNIAAADFAKAGDEAASHLRATMKILNQGSDDATEILPLLFEIEDRRLIRLYIFKQTFAIKNQNRQGAFARIALIWMNDLVRLNFNFNQNNRKLDISGNPGLVDLYPIRKLRIRSLDISDCPDIATYQYIGELPIYKLIATNSNIDNTFIRYLEHKRITTLDIAYTQVTRINPMVGMPLNNLYITGTPPDIVGHFERMNDRIQIECSDYHAVHLNKLNKAHQKNWRIKIANDNRVPGSAPTP